MNRFTLLWIAVGILLSGLVEPALAAKKYPAWTDPTAAGPDFKIQGEYVGTVGGRHPVAAQVVALGEGRFDGVLYLGGLPGAGWDEKTRFYFRGRSDQTRTHFVGAHGEDLKHVNLNFEGTIEEGLFRGRADMFLNIADDSRFEMTKTLRRSPTLEMPAPAGAIVLFDGTQLEEWTNGQLVEGNLLAPGAETRRRFKNVKLHLEFRCPFMPTAANMARGNSGVYFKKKEWEVQIIDSFGWDCHNRKAERLTDVAQCGGIHEMITPRLNMSFPPLSWQTLDIEFIDALHDPSGVRLHPALLTVALNGVTVQDRFVLPRVPPGRDPATSKENQPGPIWLQNHHGDPVYFRNIWVVEQEAPPAERAPLKNE